MKTNRKAAVLALGLALLAPLAGAQEVVDSEWWNVNFDGPFPAGAELTIGELGNLTNDSSKVVVVQPYASGVWAALDGDESYVTNKESDLDDCYIKLDTQGNDLTWTPTNENAVIKNTIALVDAQLFLVGSDTAPDSADFDGNKDVQSAIFLKNETDEESGETTNSILCVYVYDDSPGVKKNVWWELEGRAKTPTNDIPDNDWYHVTVLVDHSDESSPMVEVYVDGIQLHVRGGSDTRFSAANMGTSAAAGRIQSVSFRGTGAIDNFVGQTRKETYPKAYFKAVAFLDDGNQPFMERTTQGDPLEIGKDPATFTDPFYFDSIELTGELQYALDRIEVDDLSTDPATTRTYRFEYDETEGEPFPLTELDPDPTHILVQTETEDGESWQTGNVFIRNLSTAGATQPENYEDPATAITIARLYFKTLGAFYANKVTEINGTVATNGTLLKPVAAGGTYPTNLVWTFPATDGANVLTGVKVENGAKATYDSATRVATATVTLATALETNKTFVTATYAEGSYEGKTPTWIDNEDGTYVLGNYVAKIDGDPKPVFYETLAAAISAVPTDGTETKVELIADITVPEGTTMFQTIGANRNVYLDFGGHTVDATAMTSQGIVFRVQGTALFTNGTVRATGWVAGVMATKATHQGVLTIADGTYVSTDADAIQIAGMPNDDFAGSLTIAGGSVEAARYAVAYTEAGASVTVTGGTLTSHAAAAISGSGTDGYAGNTVTVTGGKLVADGAGLSAGNSTCGIYCPNADTVVFGGEAEIESTGAGIVACAGSVTVSGGTITTTGTVAGTVASNPDELPPAALVFDTKAGYPGYAAAAKIAVSGGTFVSAVNPVQQVAAEGDATAIEITGGWFSAEPAAAYVATGLTAVQDAANAPDENAMWTVKAAAVQIDGETGTYLSIAAAKAAAAEAGIADPVFVIVGELSEETVTLAYGDTLKIKVAEGGDVTALTVETSETDTAQYAYAVADETDTETGVTTYSVVQTTKTYEIVFNVDQVAVLTTNAPYGDTLYGPATDPTKDSSETTDFAFAGWTNVLAGGAAVATADLPAVTTNATWDAVFTESVRKYTITWTMDDDSVIDTTTVAYGATPTHADPTKASTAEFSYEFAGWDPEVVAATGPATYTATFTPVLRSYTVTFWTNEVDVGTAYHSTNAPYGTHAAAYAPTNDPTRAATSTTNFTFAGWTNAVAGGAAVATADLPDVTTNAAWAAVWTETPIWTVTFKNGDDTIYETNYLDGATAEYVGATPTKASTPQYDFTFAGWDPALDAVTADTVYAATFSSNAVEYAIAYDLDGGQWPAGYTPTNSYTFESAAIVLPTPVKDGYEFTNWTNALGEVVTGVVAGSTGDQSFGAKWTAAALDPVDPGQDMSDSEKIDNPPVAVVTDPVTGDVAFTVHFRGEEGVTYQLVASESCAITEEQWKGEAASGNAVPVGQAKTTDDADQNGIIELAVPMSGGNVPDVRFFKIKATR